MKPLESRKQLLIAESELNRAHLVQEWQTMAGEARALARQARTIGSLASVAALLAAGLSSFHRKQSGGTTEKTSWWRTILKCAGLASSIWSAFRSKDHAKN